MLCLFFRGAVTQCALDCVYYPGSGAWDMVQTTFAQICPESIVVRCLQAQDSDCLVQNLALSVTGTVTLGKGIIIGPISLGCSEDSIR